MAQIAPHRALARLSTDCSMWLQIESGRPLDFVSFCQAVLKTNVSLSQTLVWEGLFSIKIQVCSSTAGGKIPLILLALHIKYQTQLPNSNPR